MNPCFVRDAATGVSLRLYHMLVIACMYSFLVAPACAGNTPPAMPVPGRSQVSFHRMESVLERFRSFTGERSRSTLGNLFRRKDAAFTQDPAVLLSDGTAQVRVTVRISTQGELSPSFMVAGGQCVGVNMKNNNAWVLDIVPDRGSSATSITILSENSMVEYPLAVAPPLNIFDAKKADASLVEYVETANELVSDNAALGRK